MFVGNVLNFKILNVNTNLVPRTTIIHLPSENTIEYFIPKNAFLNCQLISDQITNQLFSTIVTSLSSGVLSKLVTEAHSFASVLDDVLLGEYCLNSENK